MSRRDDILRYCERARNELIHAQREAGEAQTEEEWEEVELYLSGAYEWVEQAGKQVAMAIANLDDNGEDSYEVVGERYGCEDA